MRVAPWILSGCAVLLALTAWVAAGDTFEVGGQLQGPVMVEAGPMYWTRGCLGTTYERTAIDATWTRCLGVPHGPRQCYGYPTPPDTTANWLDDDLPLGPLREIECPDR